MISYWSRWRQSSWLVVLNRCWADSFSRSEVLSYLYIPISFQFFLSLCLLVIQLKKEMIFDQIGRIKTADPWNDQYLKDVILVHKHISSDDGEGVSPYYGMGSNWMFLPGPRQKSRKEGGTCPASRHRITIATTTQTKNKTGRIHWKRAKRNMETKYGLRIGILNIGLLERERRSHPTYGGEKTGYIWNIGYKGKDRLEKSHP